MSARLAGPGGSRDSPASIFHLDACAWGVQTHSTALSLPRAPGIQSRVLSPAQPGLCPLSHQPSPIHSLVHPKDNFVRGIIPQVPFHRRESNERLGVQAPIKGDSLSMHFLLNRWLSEKMKVSGNEKRSLYSPRLKECRGVKRESRGGRKFQTWRRNVQESYCEEGILCNGNKKSPVWKGSVGSQKCNC